MVRLPPVTAGRCRSSGSRSIERGAMSTVSLSRPARGVLAPSPRRERKPSMI
jgi:hypothetical protein